jgi:hypothetical protein
MPSRILPPNEVLKELYLSPMSAGEIAKKLSANVNTVAAALTRIPGLVMRGNSEAQLLAFKRGKKAGAAWRGKKQPREMVEKRISKIRGENHWLWKGGKGRREYRGLIEKTVCSKCGSRINLCIHHIDFDHYNNNPENLQVLCVSCHLSLHKTEYWKAMRENKTPRRSTAPHHWKGGK